MSSDDANCINVKRQLIWKQWIEMHPALAKLQLVVIARRLHGSGSLAQKEQADGKARP